MSERLILVLHGPAGSGKDTAADYLVRRYGFVKESFARPLKRAITAIFGIPYPDLCTEEGKAAPLPPPWAGAGMQDGGGLHIPTNRALLQVFGTDLCRDLLCEDIWVLSLVRRLTLLPAVERWVIADGRFQNELELQRFLPPGFARVLTVRISGRCRPGGVPGGIHGHPSEQPLPCNFILDNSAPITTLEAGLDNLLDYIFLPYKPNASPCSPRAREK